MARKSQKANSSNKIDKKAKEKLEISLRKKIKDFVFSLGHDAEEIGDEIKKTSKILAKRLNRKLKETKKTIEDKVKKSKKINPKKTESKVDEIVYKAKKEAKKLDKKSSSVKSVDVLPTIKKETKRVAPVKKPVVAKSTATKAVTKTAPVKISAKAAPSKATQKTTTGKASVNAHPETPVVKRRRATATPKSDTKPQNTDLPLEAGPRNKYKRG